MHRTSRLLSKSLPPDDLAAAIWPAAVGKRLASRTGAVKLYGTKLVVDVEDAVWQSQLTTLAPDILSKIQKMLTPGRVQALEFRVGAARRQPGIAITAEGPQDLADGIADPIFRHLYLASRAEAERQEAKRMGASA